MGLARFSGRVGPPIALVLPAMLLTASLPAPFATAAPAASRVDCNAVTPMAAARAAIAPSGTSVASASVRAQLNGMGELVARSLTADSGTGTPIAISLPTESFVGRPQGDLVVYTLYTSTSGSEVRAVNAHTRCDIRLAAPEGIVRSAVLDQTATALFVHGVTRGARADAGVVRHELQSGSAAQVVPPLTPPADFGPVFGTELRWSVDGNALAVQSCGLHACLTRILDLRTGAITAYTMPDQGAFVALSDAHLITYAACGGLPCAVLSTDLKTGSVAVLASGARDVQASAMRSAVSLAILTSAGVIEVIQ